MVIDDAQKLAFCHIPKNGGSSLRRHLLETWTGARQHTGCVPVAAADGAIRDLTHLTVAEAQAYFGEDLVDRGYRVIAVVRPPESRVRSALYQYLRVVYAEDRDYIGSTDAIAFLRSVSLADLCERSAKDYTCVHFRPQVDFLAGAPDEALDLIPISQLGERFPALPHVNTAGSLPGWLRPLDRPILRRALRGLGSGIKRRIRGALTRRDDEIQKVIAEIASAEQDFTEAFYAADQALYQKVVASNPA